MSEDSDGPPRGPIPTERLPYPRYAPTPMPEHEEAPTSTWSWTLIWACVVVVAVHTWAMAQLHSDVQTILQYQQEHAQQAMQATPTQWRIVPN